MADEHHNQGVLDEDKGVGVTHITFTCVNGQHEVTDSNGETLGVIFSVVDTYVFHTNRRLMMTTEQIMTIAEYMRELDE